MLFYGFISKTEQMCAILSSGRRVYRTPTYDIMWSVIERSRLVGDQIKYKHDILEISQKKKGEVI